MRIFKQKNNLSKIFHVRESETRENIHYLFLNKYKINKAFTLAEVLITLTILGIIATLLITGVIKHYKKAITVTKLKLAYSMLVNATELAEIESRKSSDNWEYAQGSYGYVRDKILPHLPVAQNCSSTGNCIGDNGKKLYGSTNPDYTYINLGNGTYSNQYWLGQSGAILKNGMSVAFGRCLAQSQGYGVTNIACTCFIDIDGPNKGANQINKDIFPFFYTGAEADTQTKNPRFSPLTVEWHLKRYGTTSDCKPGQGCLNVKSYCKNGEINSTCWAYIMMNGWKIPDDYPVKF